MIASKHLARHSRIRPNPAQLLRHIPKPRDRSIHATSVLGRARHYSSASDGDPRLKALGRRIEDDYARIRENYATPKLPVVLAHGLLGFAELKVAGSLLPPLHYWWGIAEALRANGVEVITAAVPPSGSIEQRAEKLGEHIAQSAHGRSVNIVAHSMGGLDARYMISHLQPKNVDVRSLVTVATPHHGSAFADFVFDEIGEERLPRLYSFARRLGVETGAFSQLTQKYMTQDFNPKTPDDPTVQYFSYGAMMNRPPLLSPLRTTWQVVQNAEGPNDGLVSVESSQWGKYKGTLVEIWFGKDPRFNAVAFYLDIADMLAKEGL
ncbi:triacylglycerol lipase [Seiridium cupressi]